MSDLYLAENIKDSNGGVATYCRPMPVVHKRPDNTDIPIDKVNKDFWEKVEQSAITGQTFFEPVCFDSNAGKEDRPALVRVVVGFNMEGVSMSRGMSGYKKSVIEAVDALYRAGNRIMTEGDILRCMGVKNPTKAQKDKLYKAMVQMRHTDVSINNTMETKVHSDAPLIKAEASLLEYRALSYVEGNGGIVKRAYVILEKPILMQYARARGSFIEVNQAIWEGIPISLTEGSIAIRDYLIERIARQGSEPRILWDTIRQKCKIKSHNDGLKKRVTAIMDYFVREGYLESVTYDTKGVGFVCAKGQKKRGKGQKNGGKGQKNGDRHFPQTRINKGLAGCSKSYKNS